MFLISFYLLFMMKAVCCCSFAQNFAYKDNYHYSFVMFFEWQSWSEHDKVCFNSVSSNFFYRAMNNSLCMYNQCFFLFFFVFFLFRKNVWLFESVKYLLLRRALKIKILKRLFLHRDYLKKNYRVNKIMISIIFLISSSLILTKKLQTHKNIILNVEKF